jgi:hydrogenase 3 maturation protease
MYLSDLKNRLSIYDSSEVVFIGLGNELRGDDWAGIYLLRKLKASGCFKGAHFIEAGISPENYVTNVLDLSPAVIVFIDASRCGSTPGEIKFIDPADVEMSGFSTHSYSIKLIEKFFMYCQDIKFVYIGIVPLQMNMGKGLSFPVIDSIKKMFEPSV